MKEKYTKRYILDPIKDISRLLLMLVISFLLLSPVLAVVTSCVLILIEGLIIKTRQRLIATLETQLAGLHFAYLLILNLKGGFNLKDAYFVASFAVQNTLTLPSEKELRNNESFIVAGGLEEYRSPLMKIFSLDLFAHLRFSQCSLFAIKIKKDYQRAKSKMSDISLAIEEMIHNEICFCIFLLAMSIFLPNIFRGIKMDALSSIIFSVIISSMDLILLLKIKSYEE